MSLAAISCKHSSLNWDFGSVNTFYKERNDQRVSMVSEYIKQQNAKQPWKGTFCLTHFWHGEVRFFQIMTKDDCFLINLPSSKTFFFSPRNSKLRPLWGGCCDAIRLSCPLGCMPPILECQFKPWARPLQIQLPADAPGGAEGDGSYVWVSTFYVGDLEDIPHPWLCRL